MISDLFPSGKVIEIRSVAEITEVGLFLKKIGIPQEIIQKLQMIVISVDKEQIYRQHYEIIQNDRYDRDLPFSVEDFILAYIATEMNCHVVSYDHHLMHVIKQFLNYDSYWPEDLLEMEDSGVFLLDTNILLGFLQLPARQQAEITQMICNTNHEFYVPEPIFFECQNVLIKQSEKFHNMQNKKERKKKMQKRLNVEDQIPSDLKAFIEDYEDFDSPNAERRLKRKKKEIRKEQQKQSPLFHKRWLVSHRFQSVYHEAAEKDVD